MLGHRRLQIDTRLRLIGKWHQHKYGDKVATTVTGPNGGPVVVAAAAMSDEQLAKIAAGGSK